MLDFEKIAQDAYYDEMDKIADMNDSLRNKLPGDLNRADSLRIGGNMLADGDNLRAAGQKAKMESRKTSGPSAMRHGAIGAAIGTGVGHMLKGKGRAGKIIGGLTGAAIGAYSGIQSHGVKAAGSTVYDSKGDIKRSAISKYNHK